MKKFMVYVESEIVQKKAVYPMQKRLDAWLKYSRINEFKALN